MGVASDFYCRCCNHRRNVYVYIDTHFVANVSRTLVCDTLARRGVLRLTRGRSRTQSRERGRNLRGIPRGSRHYRPRRGQFFPPRLA